MIGYLMASFNDLLKMMSFDVDIISDWFVQGQPTLSYDCKDETLTSIHPV